ncbi:hypothetical protein [Flavobacterium channae]|uniref:hypothetical protein n=1 Tax=Flavobacterium channae TaxID=2897181 RepID=UPI001E322BBC|nr:hypothetical protein [Flavobacterium channae]UGS24098.1 hypothetical protein LOS89_02225 [Flavobacterium channae]
MEKEILYNSKIAWYSYLNTLLLILSVSVFTYVDYLGSEKVNLYLIAVLIITFLYCIHYLKYFTVSNNELSIIRPFWFVRKKVFQKTQIEQIRFYNNKSGNFGGRFMNIKLKNNHDIVDFRIEFTKKQRDLFVNSLQNYNFNVWNELKQ